MTVLDLNDVTLTYPDGVGRLTALDNVSMRVRAGELVGVVGPSGSGKSSLLAVAATLVAPDSGSVRIDGVETAARSRRAKAALRRDKLGLVFQQPNLLDSLTTLEQLTVAASLGSRSRRAATSEARGLLEAVGLSGLEHRRPAQLSGGQRQRVNIARALVGSPVVLLIDEPTSALDHERGSEVMDLIRRMTTERSVGTVLVTHDTTHLGAADRVLECFDGCVAEREPVAADALSNDGRT